MNYKYTLIRSKKDERDIRFSEFILPHSDVVLPKSVDLRPKCPPVYDQGDLGACTAFTGCVCREMLTGDKSVNLSKLFLYFVERGLEGDIKKDSGASLKDTCKAMHKIGVCEEKYMPYDISKFTAIPKKKAFINAAQYRITAYKLLDSLDEIKQNLALRQQPVMMGMDVYESFESDVIAKTGIMSMPGSKEKKLGGHAVLVVGYRDIIKSYGMFYKNQVKTGSLIVRNSWGSNWGDKGYFHMPYDYVTPENTYDYWIME